MDDLEFRRRILSDPKQKDEEILQALAASDATVSLLMTFWISTRKLSRP